jgi:hypothetical protein
VVAVPCRKLATSPHEWRRGWHSVEQAAERLRLSRRRVRQRCERYWRHAGFATKIRGKWAISPNADPKLSNIPIETDDNRYLRQLNEMCGEMWTKCFGERRIKQAINRRQVVLGFYAFKGHTRAEARLSVEYISKLRADGVFPSEDIPRLSRGTLRRWCDLYCKPGDAGGFRALAHKLREKHLFKSIGDEAWAFFVAVVHPGPRIKVSVSAAHEQTLGYIIRRRLSQSPGWAWPSLRTVQVAYRVRLLGL